MRYLGLCQITDRRSRLRLISILCAARSGGVEPAESSSSCSMSKIRRTYWIRYTFMMMGLGLGTGLARSSTLALVHHCLSFHVGMSVQRQDGIAIFTHMGNCVSKLEEVHGLRNATVVML